MRLKTKLDNRVNSLLKEVKNFYDPYPIRRYMRKHRCIFIHIPKNGGTSILSVLGGRKYRMHLPWITFRQANRYLFDRYFKFAIVRNPFDRAVSIHSYLVQGGSDGTDEELSHRVRADFADFRSFVNEFLEPSTMHLHALLRPQAYWVYDLLGSLKVDRLYRFESLQDDSQDLLRALKIKGPLPVINTSKRRNYQDYFTPELAHRIAELYACDFQLLDYSFEI